MAVPKCKECTCVWDIGIADYSEKFQHYCHWWNMNQRKNNIYKTGFKGSEGKLIKGQEFKTSPKWCPIRKDG